MPLGSSLATSIETVLSASPGARIRRTGVPSPPVPSSPAVSAGGDATVKPEITVSVDGAAAGPVVSTPCG